MGVALAAAAGLDVIFEIYRPAHGGGDRLDRGLRQDRPAEVGVQHVPVRLSTGRKAGASADERAASAAAPTLSAGTGVRARTSPSPRSACRAARTADVAAARPKRVAAIAPEP